MMNVYQACLLTEKHYSSALKTSQFAGCAGQLGPAYINCSPSDETLMLVEILMLWTSGLKQPSLCVRHPP